MVTRSNTKVNVIQTENTIKKSNEISLARLNHGLSLNQMQLLAYFIFCTQQTGTTAFKKADFEKRFDLSQYKTTYAKNDVKKLMELKIATSNLEDDEFAFWNVFIDIEYKQGMFKFNWHPKFLPHIMNLKEQYIINNLSMTSHFKSSYSWVLYEYLKAHYGYFHKVIQKAELLRIFNVEHHDTYVKNTGRFKQSVLDIAINEINEFTDLHVHYREIKEGRKVVAFDIHWSIGKQVMAASIKFVTEIETLFETIEAMSSEILKITVPKAQEKAMENFKEAITLQETLLTKDFLTKEEAEIIYYSLSNKFKRIDHAIHCSELYEHEFYNWLEERE